MKKHIFYIITLAVFSSSVVIAQNQMTSLPLIRTLPQASYLNPGMMPDYKVAVAVPVFGGIYTSTDINFINANRLFSKTADGYMDINGIYNGLARRNRITNYQEIPIFHLGIRNDKSHTAFSVNTRMFSRFTAPKDILGVLTLGNNNPEFAGREIPLNDFSFISRTFTEIGLSHAREILPNLNVGVRVKYLLGHYDLSLNQIDATLGNYGMDSITFRTREFDFNTSGGVGDLIDGNDFDPLNLTGVGNNGFGLDIGAEYKLMDRLNIYASVIDLGFINWRRGTTTFRFPEASISFKGVTELFGGDAANIGQELDSAISAFKPYRVDGTSSYTTALNGKIYAGAGFDIVKGSTVGALMFSELYQGQIIPAISFYYNAQYKTILDFVVNVSVMNNRVDNIGLGFTGKLWVFQYYFVTNSILSYTNPISAQSINLRTGFNLNIGDINKVKRRGKKNSDTIMLDI